MIYLIYRLEGDRGGEDVAAFDSSATSSQSATKPASAPSRAGRCAPHPAKDLGTRHRWTAFSATAASASASAASVPFCAARAAGPRAGA
jgi:hypothetical protein